MVICKSCIYDENVWGIKFNSYGICNYCDQIKLLENKFKTGTIEGIKKFEEIVKKIKKTSKGKKYDVIIGVSGGTDSSFLMHLACESGLRPLAVHYDNTWNTAIATQNIKKLVTKLDIDLETYVIDSREQDDIFLAFLKAGVCGADASTDLALAEVTYRMAKKYGVKYVFEGHSFQAEGVSPLNNSYTDGKFIKSVVKTHSNRELITYPNMTFWRFIWWTVFNQIKKIRPLWYLSYDKNSAKALLENKYDWKDYGGHHLENRISAFDHSYLMPKKFKVDQRNNSLSAAVRSGVMERDEALYIYSQEPFLEQGIIDYVKKRLKLDDKTFNQILNGPIRTFKNYKTYKSKFERYRLLFKILSDYNLVPSSFYLKYCLPIRQSQ